MPSKEALELQARAMQNTANGCEDVQEQAKVTARCLRQAYSYRPDMQELKDAAECYESIAEHAMKARAALTRVVDKLELQKANATG